MRKTTIKKSSKKTVKKNKFMDSQGITRIQKEIMKLVN